MGNSALQLAQLRARLHELVASRPSRKLADFGYLRSDGLPAEYMGLKPDFLYDRFSTELRHPCELTSEFIRKHLARLDFVLELSANIWAYYFPALLLEYLEAVEGDSVALENYRSAFEISIHATGSKVSVLAAAELMLLRDAIEFVHQSYAGYYSRKQHKQLIGAVDLSLTMFCNN